MPPNSSLSSRDGRLSSASVHGNEPYYSNDDIEILHEVVSLAEEILPTLADRDRLPTNALFRAADIVLPQHGFDPEEDTKFTRIIFRIGGLRGDGDLLDKFRAVLDEMGIELEFVDQNEPPRSQYSAPAPEDAAAPLFAENGDDRTGTFSIAPHLHGRRRRNSDSVVLPLVDGQAERPRPRRRSASIIPGPKKHIDARPPVRHPAQRIGPWLAEIPAYQRRQASQEHELDSAVESGSDDEENAPYHPYPNPNLRLEAARPFKDFPFGNGQRHPVAIQNLQDSPMKSQRHGSQPIWQSRYGAQHISDENASPTPGYISQLHLAGHHKLKPQTGGLPDLPRHGLRDITFPRRDLGRPPHVRQPIEDMPSVLLEQELRNLQEEARDAYTARSLRSIPGSEDVDDDDELAMDDQMEDGPEPEPKIDLEIMAKISDAFNFSYTTMRSYIMWRYATILNREQLFYAYQMDKELSASEAVLVWSDRAGTVVQEANEPLPEHPVAPEGGQLDSYRLRMEHRASRAYNISIMHKAFTHWQALTAEDLERTDVARRHLLRLKFFGAWCDQKVEDDYRVYSFRIRRAVHTWTNAVAKRKRQRALAALFYEQSTSQQSFTAWKAGYQERLADGWLADNAKRRCFRAWTTETQRMVDTEEQVDQHSAHGLIRGAIDVWIHDTNEQRHLMNQVAEDADGTLCREVLSDWKKLLFLEQNLRALLQLRDNQTKSEFFRLWSQKAHDLESQESRLEADRIQDYVKHWRLETRVAAWNAEQEHDIKSQALYDWVLMERLAFFERYQESELKRKCLNQLQLAYGETKQEHEALEDVAVRLDKDKVVFDLVDCMQGELSENQQQTERADGLSLAHAASDMLDVFADCAAENEELEAVAQRGAYYVTAFNAIAGWAQYAKRTREERLKRTYHAFRRRLKRAIASDCLSAWLGATEEHVASGWEADDVRAENETQDLIDKMNHWIGETNDNRAKHDIAAEADVELHLNEWRLAAEARQERGAEAVEADIYARLRHSWEGWELQAVQARGRGLTAAELADKNNKRLCRQAVLSWAEQAIHPEADETFPSSFFNASSRLSRRAAGASARKLGFSTPRAAALYAAEDGGGDDNDHNNPPTGAFPFRFDSSLLQPITEYDEEHSLRSRLGAGGPVIEEEDAEPHGGSSSPSAAAQRRLGGSMQAPPPPRGEFFEERGESAVGLPHRFRSAGVQAGESSRSRLGSSVVYPGVSQFGNDTPSASAAAGRASSSAVPFSATTVEQQQQQRGATRFSHIPRPRVTLFQQRLQEAAEMAESVQLGPMSEFDDDDDVVVEGDISDDNNEEVLQASAATLPVPVPVPVPVPAHVANTPTRWTGLVARRNVGGAAAATTTPMAPLPSPFERRLRQEYGVSEGGGGGEGGGAAALSRGSRFGLSLMRHGQGPPGSTAATPRVSFAAGVRRHGEGQ
ncbi:uncharacterized protein E0L32_008464 [Thyridium curvatum]|uniref:Sfi1 spindle body domain-containing protein n=1 Tax=Thyridium curvatum TaxID=1093900 RepID=A0A507B0S7_9PEZI|nr:uncharacterized protein E0L32_008464 [Thyridium curvatum]TPX10578.1 hypothetical protein E0L32_008464 [Thyridium curvatum]